MTIPIASYQALLRTLEILRTQLKEERECRIVLDPPKREQRLVNLCFSLVLHATDPDTGIRDKTDEEIAHWVADRIRINGFDISEPVGASWGLLKR